IDVVVGDFNTPYNSVHFDSYKNNLKSFHQFSRGTTATWAYGFPLLELDHIWLNQKLTPIQLKKFQYKISDHQLLIAKYLEN
ncbi:MAG: endonuclease/exonuclease/phosphatase family protein, partial [Olleya sp.]